MIDTILGIIKDEMNIIDVPYGFMRWASSTVPKRYWIGEYTESPPLTEDGYKEFTLMLTGTTQGSWALLSQDRATIEGHFPSIEGLRITTDHGAVAIFYENSIPVPTGDANLKRIQVNLRIKAWKGMK